jgi:hypothetical protein
VVEHTFLPLSHFNLFIVSIWTVCILFIIKYACHTVVCILPIITLREHNYIEKCILGYLRKFLSAKGYLKKKGLSYRIKKCDVEVDVSVVTFLLNSINTYCNILTMYWQQSAGCY